MSQYNSLKATIDAKVKQNGVGAITGNTLNSVLNEMVNSLGAGYQFAGVATTATNPGTPDQKVCYLAMEKGVYSHFNNIEVGDNEITIMTYDSQWHGIKVETDSAGTTGGGGGVKRLYMDYNGGALTDPGQLASNAALYTEILTAFTNDELPPQVGILAAVGGNNEHLIAFSISYTNSNLRFSFFQGKTTMSIILMSNGNASFGD